ncbi:hypothetical protein ABZ923_34575 [Streptomyces sp. NPDC046881]|uniref:hypothetical protein n=1 Tax=Streptomyces sp. NPDC046881 TaxID=3155374 RepID=UPI0033C5D7B4
MAHRLIPASLALAVAQEAAKHEDNPLREGQVYAVLVAAGYDAHEIAALASSTWERVDWCLGLLNLADNAKNALEQGELPRSLAGRIARLSEPNQQLMLNRWVRGDFKNARHAERYARAILEDEQPLLSF